MNNFIYYQNQYLTKTDIFLIYNFNSYIYINKKERKNIKIELIKIMQQLINK